MTTVHTPRLTGMHRPLALTLLLIVGVTLNGVLATKTQAADFANTLRATTFQAFDRNHNRQLDSAERRSMTIALSPLLNGEPVSESRITRFSPQLQAVYRLSNLDRVGGITSSESRIVARILAPLRTVSSRASSSQSSR